jgi:hypothetical protein
MGLTPSRPFDLFFNGNAVAVQELPPSVEFFGLNTQSEMARPGGSMRRQLVALPRGVGKESEQDIAVAHSKENVVTRLFADDREAQNRQVEGFRRLEVIDINGGFDNGLDFHDSVHRFWP